MLPRFKCIKKSNKLEKKLNPTYFINFVSMPYRYRTDVFIFFRVESIFFSIIEKLSEKKKLDILQIN